MKQSNIRFAHPAATDLGVSSPRFRRATLRFLTVALFAAAALPVLAQEAATHLTVPVTAPSELIIDPAALLAAAAASDTTVVAVEAPAHRSVLLGGTLSLPDRALLLASGVNRLLSSGASSDTPSGSVPAAAPTTHRISQLLQRALALLGTPYRWGGMSPEKGFDCSGLVSYVFRNTLGIELPRVSREMAQTGQLVAKRDELTEGDLVFFGRKGRVDHVGIYVGEGRFVHAPSRGKDVTISSLETGYWGGKFMQARRMEGI